MHKMSYINLFQPIVTLYIETSDLFSRAKQMTGFYMKRNNELKWVSLAVLDIIQSRTQIFPEN